MFMFCFDDYVTYRLLYPHQKPTFRASPRFIYRRVKRPPFLIAPWPWMRNILRPAVCATGG